VPFVEDRAVARSEITVDLGAIRANARALLKALEGAELWAVVKADGYGHGAVDVGRAALEAGAGALCVATLAEALALRSELPESRLLVLGPVDEADVPEASAARLELVTAAGPLPPGVPVHVKLDTGMGRWGLSELATDGKDVVGLMSHLASADCDPAFTELQIARFLEATAGIDGPTRHLANSAGALRFPSARLDAARCGIALYGISPFGGDPAADGLCPALSWHSELGRVLRLAPGESTGYGRRFIATAPTWIGIVPVGYADGFRRDLSGGHVVVEGMACPVVGTVSMDALAIELPRELPVGTDVTIIGDGIRAEEHAMTARTIAYEIVCGIVSAPERAQRIVVDG
jgi:alanine racemase